MEENSQEYKIRHSAEHVFAQAVKELYGDKVTLAVAHISETGFANDAKWEEPLSEEDFGKIEEKMQEIINQDLELVREEITLDQAKEMFKNNPFKLEWIEQWASEGKDLTIYRTGDSYVDFCKGPHVNKTSEIKAFKLMSVSGAYWRGDESRDMLTRVYGVAYGSQEELDQHLTMLEEAKKRDHRKLGRELDLFTFSDYVGSGLPLYTPKGALIRRLLNNYVEEIQSLEGYEQVWTPQIAKAELYKQSGHYDKYHEDMFRVMSHYTEDEMYLKPMNCPQHTQIFASKPRSYRDLPIRMTDFAMLYRDERPGELNGLARVRAFSQDDCHIFCTEDQVDAEIDRALQMTKRVMQTFGFRYRYRLSTRDPQKPEKYLGDPATWDKVEKWAVDIMKRNGIEYYDGPGEAAFYAPKMDLMATDALGREWQLSTVQIDYVQPARFGLKYIDSDGQEKTPVMLHRAILGSTERLMMVLIESYGGNFPVWLSPIQVSIMPISTDKHLDYSNEVMSQLKNAGIRVEVDSATETLGNRIRKAQGQKIPYMIVVGDKEKESGKISVRMRGNDKNIEMSVEEFINKVSDLVKNRSQEL
jgi:threonyl-tRNA synthetase